MKIILAALILTATCFGSRAVSTVGGPFVNPANQHTYYLLSPSSWTDAELFSQTLGGHLVTINDASEQSWVYGTFSTLASGDNTLWIGLNDAASEGSFVWASGEPVSYLNWSFTEPNNYEGAEDYGSIFQPSDARAGFWNDSDNVNTMRPGTTTLPTYGVVEVVPEPSAFALLGLGAAALVAFRKTRSRAVRSVFSPV